MSEDIDYIIVGQGLVGTWMSYYAQKAGKSFVILNDPNTASASSVASGVINPVTGRRIVQTWMINTLLPNAVNAYTELGNHLQETFIKEAPVVLLHPSLQMKESFEYRLTHENVYLSNNNAKDFEAFFKVPFGTGQIDSSYWIDMGTPESMIKASRDLVTRSGKSLVADDAAVGQNSVVDNGSYIESGASIGADCRISGSIVGAKAIIEDGSKIENSYIAPNSRVKSGSNLSEIIHGFAE